MRYCLKCRHLSGSGPLCTHCGRSFGGRLCNHKKGRHLNPPDANFCGQCGSTQLTEATSALPLGWVSRLLLFDRVYGRGWDRGAELGTSAVGSVVRAKWLELSSSDRLPQPRRLGHRKVGAPSHRAAGVLWIVGADPRRSGQAVS